MPVKTFYLADCLPYDFQRFSSSDVSEPYTFSAATEGTVNEDPFFDSYDEELQNRSELVTPELSINTSVTPSLGICKKRTDEEIRRYLICHTFETNTLNDIPIDIVLNPYSSGICETSIKPEADDVVEANRFFPTRTTSKVRNPSVIDASGVNCFTGRAASLVGKCTPSTPVQSYTDPCLPRHITTFLSPTFSFSKSDKNSQPRSIASAIKRRHIGRPTSIRYSSTSRGFTVQRSRDATLVWKQGPILHSRSLNCPLGRNTSIPSLNQMSETYSSFSISQDLGRVPSQQNNGERKIIPEYLRRRKYSSKVSRQPENDLSILKWQKEGRINYRSVASAIAKETRVKTAKYLRPRRAKRKLETRLTNQSNWPRRSHSFVHTSIIPRSAKCPLCEEDEPELLYKFQFKPKRMCLCRRERRIPKAVSPQSPNETAPIHPRYDSPIEKYSHSFRFKYNRPKSRYKGIRKPMVQRRSTNSGVWEDMIGEKDDESWGNPLSPEELKFLKLHQYDDALSDISYSTTATRSSTTNMTVSNYSNYPCWWEK